MNKENVKDFLIVVSCGLLIALGNLLRTTENHKIPALSLHIPSYFVCFVLTYTSLRLYFMLKEIPAKSWKISNEDPKMALYIMGIGLVTAIGYAARTLSKQRIQNQEASVSLDIWNSHVPFWTGAIGGLFTLENLVYSIGTSLGSTCGLVLMIPISFISHDFQSHLYAILQTACLASHIYLANYVFTHENNDKDRFLSPFYMLLHVSLIVPIVLLFIAGFIEGPLLLSFANTQLLQVLALSTIHGTILFARDLTLFYLLQRKPIFFSTMVYCLGTMLELAYRGDPISACGAFLVLTTLVVHVDFVNKQKMRYD